MVRIAKKTLWVAKIKDGSVIDHITSGHALGVKDMVKVEGRELNSKEVDRIALLAPHASINIVRDYKVVEKQHVKMPPINRGIARCANPSCISNSNEPVEARFYVEGEDPLCLRCHDCGYVMEKKDVLKQF